MCVCAWVTRRDVGYAPHEGMPPVPLPKNFNRDSFPLGNWVIIKNGVIVQPKNRPKD